MKRLLQQVATVVAAALAATTLSLGSAAADHDACVIEHDMGSGTSGTVTDVNRNDWWASTSQSTSRTFTMTPSGGDADLAVYAADCTTVLCTSQFGGTATDSCTVNMPGKVHPLVYYYNSASRSVSYTLTTNAPPSGDAGVVSYPGGFPSDDCATGVDIASHAVGDEYVSVRAQRSGVDTTWVCVRVDGDQTAFGGKLVVEDPRLTPVGLPTTDSNAEGCATAGNQVPGPHPHVGGTVAGVPVLVDTFANGAGAALCFRAGGTALRVLVPVSIGAVPRVRLLLDAQGRHAPTPPVPPVPSGTCQAHPNGQRLADVTTSGIRAYVYTVAVASSSGRVSTKLCVGSASAGLVGGVLAVESDGPAAIPRIEFADQSACPTTLANLTDPEPVSLAVGRTTTSASACLVTRFAALRVSAVGGTGRPVAVSWTPDPGTPGI